MFSYCFSINFKSLLIILTALFVVQTVALEARAQGGGIDVTPMTIEAVIPAGTEKTVGVAVDYDAGTATGKQQVARLVARLQDWTISPNGELQFAAAGTLPRSAAGWVTFSPSEFNVAANGRQIVRFTISVPKDTQPGNYLVACYMEDRNPPPPPSEGEKKISVRFRYYTVIYVMVPGLTAEGELTGLQAKMVNGFPRIATQMNNKGNSRLRPKHSVEIQDRNEKVVFSSQMSNTMVLLGNQSMETSYPIETELPAGNYKLIYTVDFGDKKAMQRGAINFQVTDADVALRSKKADSAVAKEINSNPPVKPESDKQVSPPASPVVTSKETVRTKTPQATPPAKSVSSRVIKPQ